MMQLVLCVDLDDDLGRKTDIETPVVGVEAIRDAAVELATADPEDSDVNVLFQGLHLRQELAGSGEPVVVAAVAGTAGDDLAANRSVGRELDAVLSGLSDADVRVVVVTDGAQDESVLPVIRSRVTIDGVRRVVVRQAQDLESMYYTIKQVLDDPETRGTILIPLGILLLIYPLSVVASYVGLPGTVLGVSSGMLGLYLLIRGFGVEDALDDVGEQIRRSLYAGRVTIITYFVAAALMLVGGVAGLRSLSAVRTAGSGEPELAAIEVLAALIAGAVPWFAAAGVTTSLGQITDEYLADSFAWRYMNAPFYVLAIAAVLHAVSAFILGRQGLTYVAAALTLGTLLGLASTFAFAVVEERLQAGTDRTERGTA